MNVIRESKGDTCQLFADVTVVRIEKSKLANIHNTHSNYKAKHIFIVIEKN